MRSGNTIPSPARTILSAAVFATRPAMCQKFASSILSTTRIEGVAVGVVEGNELTDMFELTNGRAEGSAKHREIRLQEPTSYLLLMSCLHVDLHKGLRVACPAGPPQQTGGDIVSVSYVLTMFVTIQQRAEKKMAVAIKVQKTRIWFWKKYL